MKILFLKSRVKGHVRTLPTGRVVLIPSYEKQDHTDHNQKEIAFNYRGRKEIPERFKEVAVKLWEEGCTSQYIASHIGIAAQTVIGWLREAGENVSNRRYYDKDTLSKIEGLRKEKLSYAQIADSLGISQSAIERHVQKMGIAPVRVAPPEIKAEAIEMYVAGNSPSDIGERLGFSTNAVANWVSDAGVMRSLSESRAIVSARDAPRKNDTYSKKGAFHSSKSGKWFYSASSYEYMRMKQLDDDVRVVSWGRCLDRIPYDDGLKKRYYVPDLDIVMDDGTRVVEEIKPAFKRNDQNVLAKESAATKFYLKTGAVYRVITQHEIGVDYIKQFDWSGFSAFTQNESREIRKERVRQNSRDRRSTLRKALPLVLFFD